MKNKLRSKTLWGDLFVTCFALFLASHIFTSNDADIYPFRSISLAFLVLSLVAFCFYNKEFLKSLNQKILKYKRSLFVLLIIMAFLSTLLETSNLIKCHLLWWQITAFYIFLTYISIALFNEVFNENKKNTLITNKVSALLLFGIIMLSLSFRLYHLDFLPLAGDEYRHILAMKHFLSNGYFDYTDSKLTNYLLILIAKYFSADSIFIFRLPFSIIGILSTILFYVVGKEIFNKPTGLIAAFMFSCMPLSVGLSKYIRCYSIELFIFLLAIFLLHTKRIKSYFLRLFLVFSLIYSFIYFDHGTRFIEYTKLFLAYILAFSILKTLTYLKKSFDLKVFSLIFLFISGVLYLAMKNHVYAENFEIESRFLFFFNAYNSSSTWFPFFIPSFLIFTIFLFPLSNKKGRKDELLALYFTMFFSLFSLIFILELPRSFQDRYAYYVLPFFLLPLSFGFSMILSALHNKNFLSKFTSTVLLISLLLLPTKAIILSKQEAPGEVDQKTGLTHYNTIGVYEFLEKNNVSAEQLIVTSPWIFDHYFNEPFLDDDEKGEFVKFPPTQSYEFKDRTKIFSVAGCRDEASLAQVKSLIEENTKLKYLIIHTPLDREESNFQPQFAPSRVESLKLIDIIDSEKSFGFYIYEINTKNQQ